jgi:NAD(P)-dependent dehydrogenase (short-subunit alcohol dehydrogenase family)
MLLADKRIILTGCASGIGAAAARAFVAEGAHVACLDIAESGRDIMAEAAGGGPGRAGLIRCDVSAKDEVTDAVSDAVARMGGLDSLVHVAGIFGMSPAHDIGEADWARMLAVNLDGTVHANQAVFAHLRDNGGSIVNFGSNAGVVGMPGAGHYAASKGAVLAWTRTIAREWGQYGIRANAIAPGIHTPMYEAFRASLAPPALADYDKAMRAAIPLGGKRGDPDRDLAPVLVFMVSDASRFITGQTISVDGGKLILT